MQDIAYISKDNYILTNKKKYIHSCDMNWGRQFDNRTHFDTVIRKSLFKEMIIHRLFHGRIRFPERHLRRVPVFKSKTLLAHKNLREAMLVLFWYFPALFLLLLYCLALVSLHFLLRTFCNIRIVSKQLIVSSCCFIALFGCMYLATLRGKVRSEFGADS